MPDATRFSTLDRDRDAQTLQSVAAGVEALRSRMLDAQQRIDARQRGYLLPDEDDAIRRLFLGYRNYRLALLEIIDRHQAFDREDDLAARDEAFMLAFTAAVMLYDWSSTLVNTYRDVPVIRAKLNEPDPRYGIEEGLFERIYESLTSLRNLGRLRDAVALYELHHERFRLRFKDHLIYTWLMQQADRLCPALKRHDVDILRERVERGWDHWQRRAAKPFSDVRYQLTTLVMDIFGNIWIGDRPQIPEAQRQAFLQRMQPGDFFIVRPERKSSTIFLPGWWTHCAFYHGGPKALGEWVEQLPHVRQAQALLTGSIDGAPAVTLEALSAGVVLNPLHRTLNVDHAVAVRPRLDPESRRQAIDDAFAQLGKPYDFEFDFTRTDRLVCTEVIYRTLHGKGAIRFDLRQRYGRPTLSADDVADTILAGAGDAQRPFEIVALCKRQRNGTHRLYEGDRAWRLFAAIRRDG